MAALKVTIDAKQNNISVFNDDDAIPVEIPKLICGHLLTNSNYDDNVKKTTSGCNGYSVKLTNIFSTEFIIKIVDRKGKKKLRLHRRRTPLCLPLKFRLETRSLEL
ncbi:hypothetical protein V8G54_030931 [Vigna mungo]|uniref:DNA topoisomerase (ATP-hydrolyzing) n=1 Tax=Vigna mungo TaxID=3915 RepID=A0AAQ3MX73_VIGMU